MKTPTTTSEPLPPAAGSATPMHDWFSLSYASYLVIPRTILQSCTRENQQRLADALDAIYEECSEHMENHWPYEATIHVQLKDSATGRFVKDDLADYQRILPRSGRSSLLWHSRKTAKNPQTPENMSEENDSQKRDSEAVDQQQACSAFSGPRVCQHCGYYAQVRRRTVNQGWHVAEWGECRKADLTKTGAMTGKNETCDDFTPDPRRWPNAALHHTDEVGCVARTGSPAKREGQSAATHDEGPHSPAKRENDQTQQPHRT